MILLGGATLVLPDRLVAPGTLVLDQELIVEVVEGTRPQARDLTGHTIVPGFVDVHVHGVDGTDVFDDADAIRKIARRLPRYGVTAFCPTTIACTPASLRGVLDAVRLAREHADESSARVLPAHLESNFISPEFKGAQPRACICAPGGRAEGEFTGADILAEIANAHTEVGIITVAPEVPGVLDVIADLVRRGHRVSIGHSGATYDEANAAIDAGARQATHLFNRMRGLHHRDPGLSGAVLDNGDVAAEVICDGVHVHPAVVRTAVAAKGPGRMMAITDGTAGSGLASGARATLGGRPITVGDAAYLDDGTLAGSVLTMDRAFSHLSQWLGGRLTDVARLCGSTASRELGLGGGTLSAGALADFVILDRDLRVFETWIGGRRVYGRALAGP